MSTKFFTNDNDRNLFDKFEGILREMANVHAFHAVVGYFRSSGYFELQPHLMNVSEIKILVGINVDRMFAEAQRKGLMFFGDDQKTKEEFQTWFIEDVSKAKYTKEVEQGIRDFISDLTTGRIEVRAHSSKTIHAKFFIFLPEIHTENSDGWVIMGSSNLTRAGLGIEDSPNYELNIALKDYDDVQFTKQEFDKLWEESTQILPADIEEAKAKTHIDRNFTPYEIYLKLLIEYFGENIEYGLDAVGDLPPSFKKLNYQVDAVNQGYSMLQKNNGFFLADVVGLGKTVVAAMIASRFRLENGYRNTKILVVYPPAVEKNWKSTFREFKLSRSTKFITNGSLQKILDKKNLDYWDEEEYDLILVDEAHRFRNHTSRMFDQLQRICRAPRASVGEIGGTQKKVMLITATPLNNRPDDIYYQLQLFQDSRRSSLDVTNLQSFFGPLIDEYKREIKSSDPNLSRIRGMFADIRAKVLEPIIIRRTRKDLENISTYKDDLVKQGVVFPEIEAPRAIEYKMDAELNLLFNQTLRYIDENKALDKSLREIFGDTLDYSQNLNYSRYRAIENLKPELLIDYDIENASLIGDSLSKIMRTLLIKRLESSTEAFRTSVNNLRKSTQRMIEMFEADSVLVAPDLDVNALFEKGYSLEEIEEKISAYNEKNDENNRNRVFSAQDFDKEFLPLLREDLELLKKISLNWNKVTVDPKLEVFFGKLDSEFLSAKINPSGKLVIFTESKDTANYLALKIEDRTNLNVLNISSDNRNKLFDTIQANFDANYDREFKNDYNILISTDVLAEGVNLHRANVIINYDTPWNATRLMQRIGRVNRIGSTAPRIYNYSFYPSAEGDSVIRLYNNALVKLQSFHTAFGEDAQVYSHEELVEQFKLFKEGENQDEDKRLTYLEIIRNFRKANPKEFEQIKNFPLKARTARDAKELSDKSVSTVAYLKSPYKSEFYKVDAQARVTELTFLEAVEIFKAEESENALALLDAHYEDIENTLTAFERNFVETQTETVASIDRADATTKSAVNFLRERRSDSKDGEIREACDHLLTLVSNGTFAQLPKEVRKIRIAFNNERIEVDEAVKKIKMLSEKYSYEISASGDSETLIDYSQTPEVVISESFVK